MACSASFATNYSFWPGSPAWNAMDLGRLLLLYAIVVFPLSLGFLPQHFVTLHLDHCWPQSHRHRHRPWPNFARPKHHCAHPNWSRASHHPLPTERPDSSISETNPRLPERLPHPRTLILHRGCDAQPHLARSIPGATGQYVVPRSGILLDNTPEVTAGPVVVLRTRAYSDVPCVYTPILRGWCRRW